MTAIYNNMYRIALFDMMYLIRGLIRGGFIKSLYR